MSRKKALITGGEYGMGRGIAACLAEAGYDIAFSYYPGMNDPLKAVETSEAILREKGAEVWCYPADLSKREAPKWLFRVRSRTSPRTISIIWSGWISVPM